MLIVDDSSIVRRALSDGLATYPGIRVVGAAPDPFVAREMILSLDPHVLLLDIEMPRMDGLSFVMRLMKHHPMPIIVVSSVAKEGSATAIACLEAGAVEVLCEPNESYSIGNLVGRLAELIPTVARMRVRARGAAEATAKAIVKAPRPPTSALIAPGDLHTRLARDGARYIVRVGPGPRVCRHRPSVEVLFESFARHAGANAVGAILTGMGNDGAVGLLSMRNAGATTIAQDEATSVVFGMPRVAIEAGAAMHVLPLPAIPGRILEFARARVAVPARA